MALQDEPANKIATVKAVTDALGVTSGLEENKLITYGELLSLLPEKKPDGYLDLSIVEKIAELNDYLFNSDNSVWFVFAGCQSKSWRCLYDLAEISPNGGYFIERNSPAMSCKFLDDTFVSSASYTAWVKLGSTVKTSCGNAEVFETQITIPSSEAMTGSNAKGVVFYELFS